MKRNGDVKLAAVNAAAIQILESFQTRHLFEIFDTPAQAIDSFRSFSNEAVSPAFLSGPLQGTSESAA